MDMVAKAVKQFDEIAEEYAKKLALKSSEERLQVFKKYVSPGNSVLDVGCAAGRDTHLLSEEGYRVTGIDLSKNLLAIAKKEYPTLSFILGDIRKLPFKDNAFDAIWASAVIHHLEKKEMMQSLKEFFRVLKPKGVVLLTTKRGKGIWNVSEDLSLNTERAFTLLTAAELAAMLDNVGFKKKELLETKSKEREVDWIRALYVK